MKGSAADLARRLSRLNVQSVAHSVLTGQADALAEAVRGALSQPPGAPHATPWLQTGALRDSIEVDAGGDALIVGSTSPVAVWQENGTSRMPPRPFLAPAARDAAQGIADEIGASVAELFR